MRVLVLSASGLLGSNVVVEARNRGQAVAGIYNSTAIENPREAIEFDLREPGAIGRILDRTDPEVVVNCAALIDIDACETDPDAAQRINADAPGEIAGACSRRGIEFAQTSTDYVFSGEARSPYPETDDTDPIQVYGQTKRDGERSVSAVHENALITRLSANFGVHRETDRLRGFPAWVSERLEAGGETPLFTDQYYTPSETSWAAERILDLLSASAIGLYHVTSRSCTNPWNFGHLVADYCGFQNPDGVFRRASRSTLDRSAPRPGYSCLGTERVDPTAGERRPTIDDLLGNVSAYL
jgi:dTDP-4-dehydrorhamnose reductase